MQRCSPAHLGAVLLARRVQVLARAVQLLLQPLAARVQLRPLQQHRLQLLRQLLLAAVQALADLQGAKGAGRRVRLSADAPTRQLG